MSMHELVHHSFSDGDPFPVELSAIHQVLTTGKHKKEVEEIFWCKNGESFPVEYSSYPILENGEVTGAVTVFRDITERNEMNQQMNFLAMDDPLTRLMNRYAFDKQLKIIIEEARHNNTEHALCYMELMTLVVMLRVTPCCRCLPSYYREPCVKQTLWRGWVVMSLACF